MNPTQEPIQTELQHWFDEFVATLRVHQVEMETGTASPAVKRVYDTLFSGNADAMAQLNKATAQKYFVGKILYDYIRLLGKSQPLKLAFDFNDSEVLVWAEIPDDDEALERFLILSEAKINAHYHQYGFDMTTTLVEYSDGIPVPNHYQLFIG